jgi:hypothetical protein
MTAAALRAVPGSAAELAAALNQRRREMGLDPSVTRQTVAKWRAGTRTPDPDNRKAIDALWPSCPAHGWDAAIPPAASSSPEPSASNARQWIRERERADHDDADGIELVNVDLTRLQHALTDTLAGLDERERVLGCSEYEAWRRRFFAPLAEQSPLRALFADVLPPPPEDTLAALRAELEDVLSDVRLRIPVATKRLRPRHLKALVKLERAILEALKSATTTLSASELVSCETTKAITNALALLLRPHVDERLAIVESLRGGGPVCYQVANALAAVRHIQFPYLEFRDDPIGFCEVVLGFKPWSRQREILIAIRDHKQVAVRSGHKIGKTTILMAAALWWYATRQDGFVLITNATGKQLEQQDWAELTDLREKSGRCLACKADDARGPTPCPHSQSLTIDGELHKRSLEGLIATTKRKILGATARTTEALGGYSGENLLIIVDEASSLEDAMFQAFVGNTAAKGAKLVFAGNPTKQYGPFFDSYHRAGAHWHQIHVSSLEAAREGVAGLASLEWCSIIEGQDERGTESPFYQIRVKGEFPTRAERVVYALDDIVSAQDGDRYAAASIAGRLVITLDAAGITGTGDESCFAVVRGQKVLLQKLGRGWTDDDHLNILKELLHQFAAPRERALVAIDGDGVGASIFRRVMAEGLFVDVVPVYFGAEGRDKLNYASIGDESHALLSSWLRHGGCFPASPKLEQELQAIEWSMVRKRRNDREIEVSAATPKKELRKILHRSPDRLDSLRIFAYAAEYADALVRPGFASRRHDPFRNDEERIRAYRGGSDSAYDGGRVAAHEGSYDQVFDPYDAVGGVT